MRIECLEINNFRGISHLKLNFDSSEHSIVVIGINGVGKSSILDCIAILFSWFTKRLENSQSQGLSLKDEDISNNQLEIGSCSIEITIRLNTVPRTKKSESLFSWLLTRRKKENNDFSEIHILVNQIHEQLRNNPDYSLPLFIYYRTNRAVLDIPLRITTKHKFDRTEAYDEVDFRIFFEWFRNREDLENEIRLNNDNNYRDPQLDAVRQAIKSMMEGFTNLRVKRSPLRMVLEKRGQELIINQLSDGEKCLLAMVGDIARRLAILNNSDNPLAGEGIILIDEIELHLHPGWQRKIIPNLEKTFPKCQFIVTTHSPQIVSHVKSVYLLKETEEGIAVEKLPSYGKDSNYILEVLMETQERPPEVKEKILELFRLIEHDLSKAKEKREELAKQIDPEDPTLLKADVLITLKESFGR